MPPPSMHAAPRLTAASGRTSCPGYAIAARSFTGACLWLVLALVLATVAPAHGAVVINEILYNTPSSPDIEFVELLNTGETAVDLTGWSLLDGNDSNPPCVLSGTLAPGDYLVVTNRTDLFPGLFPGVPFAPTGCDDAAGTGFGWGNSSDSVRLFDGFGQLVDTVTYEDGPPWPPEADGEGHSLELINPDLDRGDPSSWVATLPPSPARQNTAFVEDLAPTIRDTVRLPSLPRAGEPVALFVTVGDDDATPGGVTVELIVERSSDGQTDPVTIPLLDDGTPPDDTAADGIFAGVIEPGVEGEVVRYWIRASDAAGNVTNDPATAPNDRFGFTAGYRPPFLKLTESMADNLSSNVDEFGEADDWVELANLGPFPISLTGRFLTDDVSRPQRWELPQATLGPGERLLLWADAQPLQGPTHAPFRLASDRGDVLLVDAPEVGGTVIDQLSYGPQNTNVGFGFAPEDATHPEYLAAVTPGSPNTVTPLSPICINELQAGSQIGAPDWIELFNRGDTTFDVSGFGLSDDAGDPGRYTLPPGTLLAPGARLTVDEATLGFGLSTSGDEVVLLTTADGTALDFVDFGPQFSDVSFGRVPDGAPYWEFLAPATRDLPNSCPAGLLDLQRVEDLEIGPNGVATWSALPEATGYDVLVGHIVTGEFADVTCSFENVPVEVWRDDAAPPPGGLRFLLVRATNDACRRGSWGVASSGQPRDAALEAAGDVCF